MARKIKIFDAALALLKGGKRKTIEYLEDALDIAAKCCGWSCCEYRLLGKDKDTGEDMVGYFFGGAWVVETKAAYDAKKEAGTFNY